MSKGKPGNAYFVTDGEHPDMEDFLTQLMETQVCFCMSTCNCLAASVAR